MIYQTLTIKISLRSTKQNTAETYSFLVNDATVASDNPL